MKINFQLSSNDQKRMQLRRRELNYRIQDLTKLIRQHERDPDFFRSVSGWRRELIDARLEKIGSGI